jgi:putative spermidine/putrescine transport system permease protein
MWRARRPLSFYMLAGLFGLFVLFLYGPIATIALLSFQGPQGGLTFPLHGTSHGPSHRASWRTYR